jgi:hypothetical protein
MFLTAPGVRENRSQVKPGRAVSELSTAHTSVITRPPAHLNPPNTHSSLSPSPTACPYPRQTEAAAATSRSEPWRRSPNPIAHSAKAPPPPSLLSARRLVAAEPTQRATHSQQPVPVPSSLSLEPQRPVPTPAQPRRQRQRAEASLGGDHPTPSRIARKPHLPRASSARAGSLPRSPPSDPPIPSSLSLEPQQPVPTLAKPRQQRQRAEASLGGDHPTPSRIARKPHLPPSLLSARRLVAAEPTQRATHPQQPVPGAPGAPTACPYPRQTEAAAATSRSEPWRRSPNPIAHSAKAPPPPSLLSARRLVAAEPTQRSTHPKQPVPRTPQTACPQSTSRNHLASATQHGLP